MKLTSTCVLLLAGFASMSAFGQAPASPLPDGPNRETAQRICSGCHSVQMFLGRGMTREQWGGVVSNMIGRGAKMSDQEFDQVVDYLATALPPGASRPTWKVAMLIPASPKIDENLPIKPGLSRLVM